jgi:hypothetical protein
MAEGKDVQINTKIYFKVYKLTYLIVTKVGQRPSAIVSFGQRPTAIVSFGHRPTKYDHRKSIIDPNTHTHALSDPLSHW